MEKTIAQALHSALVAQCSCQNNQNTDWALKWGQRLKQLMDLAPSGSGFDTGTKLISWDARKLVFETAFHHMDDRGGYDGWTYHKMTVRPSWEGVDLKVSGSNRNEIKEYVEEVFGYWLDQAAPEVPWK